MSGARQVLAGASLALKKEETFQLLSGRRPGDQVCPIPEKVMQFAPADPVVLKAKVFTKCLSGPPSGSAPGPGGCTNEMLRVCLDVPELLQLLHLAAEDFARGTTPEEANNLFKMATMTALRKTDGGVRGTGHWNHVQEARHTISGKAVHARGGEDVPAVPICFINQGWHRLRGTRSSCDNGCGNEHDSSVDRRDWSV